MQAIQTDHVPSADRVPYWKETICRDILTLDIEVDDDSQFYGAVSNIAVGEVLLSRLQSCPQHVYRSADIDPNTDQRYFLINYLIEGSGQTVQHGRELALERHSLFIQDGGDPYSMRLSKPFQFFSLRLPQSLAREYINVQEAVCALELNNTCSSGRMAASMFSALAKNADELTPVDIEIALTALLPFVGEACAKIAPYRSSTSWKESFSRILRHIDKSLHDPSLKPSTIAAECGLTMRQLNRLFEAQGETASRVIRRKRLERVRLDIMMNSNANRSISEIAYRWGFNNMSHFSEVFREAYDVTPRQMRQLRIEAKRKKNIASH